MTNRVQITAKHAIVSDTCRRNKTAEGAVEEALGRLREEAMRLIAKRGDGRGDNLHFILEIERDSSISAPGANTGQQ
jgi:hypothetical protein